jgi:hypothetical protein
MLALKLGFKDVGLIGVDYTEDSIYGKGEHELVRNVTLKRLNDCYGYLCQQAKEHGLNLFNLSSDSNIKSVPYKDIKQFINQ